MLYPGAGAALAQFEEAQAKDCVRVVLLARLISSGECQPAEGAADVMIEPGDIVDSGLLDNVGVWIMVGVGVCTLPG